jgi:hypothetical protein
MRKNKTQNQPKLQNQKNEEKLNPKNPKEESSKIKKRNLINFAVFNEKIISEINLARVKPSEYAAKLERISTQVKDNKILVDDQEMILKEGTEIFDEAIQYLLNISPLEPFIPEDGLSKSAEELLSVLIIQEGINMKDIQQNMYDLEKRLDHFGVYFGEFCEVLDYGCLDPEWVVINFILGDGDESRKDRKNIFNPLLKYIGITSGILPSTKKCTIINFVQYYFKPGQEIPELMLERYTYHPNMKEKFKQMKEKSAQVFMDKRDQYKEHFENYDIVNENGYNDYTGKKVKKIKKITKKIKDKLNGKEAITVKTIITYADGEEVVENYVL